MRLYFNNVWRKNKEKSQTLFDIYFIKLHENQGINMIFYINKKEILFWILLIF